MDKDIEIRGENLVLTDGTGHTRRRDRLALRGVAMYRRSCRNGNKNQGTAEAIKDLKNRRDEDV